MFPVIVPEKARRSVAKLILWRISAAHGLAYTTLNSYPNSYSDGFGLLPALLALSLGARLVPDQACPALCALCFVLPLPLHFSPARALTVMSRCSIFSCDLFILIITRPANTCTSRRRWKECSLFVHTTCLSNSARDSVRIPILSIPRSQEERSRACVGWIHMKTDSRFILFWNRTVPARVQLSGPAAELGTANDLERVGLAGAARPWVAARPYGTRHGYF